MNRRQRSFGYFFPGLCALALCGCPTPPKNPTQPDTTPPSFVQVTVRLEAPTAPNPRAEFDITNRDVVRTEVGTDLALRVIALAGDSESGIRNITIQSDLRWRCSFGSGSQTIGIQENAALTFSPITLPSSPMTPLQINAVSNPVGQIPCNRSAGKGPVFIGGFVRVVATNGANPPMPVSSKTFIFDFQDALGPATGTSVSTGNSTQTPYMAECRKLGVPIPPDWSLSSTEWVRHGNLKDGMNLLQPGRDAFVWTYTHPRVRGACVALPRSSGGARGGLAGIICQSATTGHACFWDSRLRDNANPMAQMPLIDWTTKTLKIAELKDATNLTEPDSGRCPDCHQGNNVFLIAPDEPTWTKVLKTASLGSNFTTQVETSSDNQGGRPRYIPVTGVNGQKRVGWDNTFQAGGCGVQCHETSPSLSSMGMGPFTTPSPMPPSCSAGGVQNCYR